MTQTRKSLDWFVLRVRDVMRTSVSERRGLGHSHAPVQHSIIMCLSLISFK